MTRDDITRIAREAGFVGFDGDNGSLRRFAALVAAAERNRTWTQAHWTEYERSIAAAERKRLHDKFMEIHKSQQHSNNYWHFAARKIMEEPDAA
jgi:hypothetical protein